MKGIGMIFLMEQECVDGGIKFFFKKTPNVLEIENRIVLLYLLNHQKNNTTMRNTILFLLCLLPFVSFSQMVYNDGYVKVKYVDLFERDRLKQIDSVVTPIDKKVKTNKLYIVETNSKEIYVPQSQMTMFSLDDVNNGIVFDDYNNPTKLTFTNTNFEVLLEKDEKHYGYDGLGFFEFDSVIEHTTNHGFRVELVYFDGLITSVQVNFDSIGTKTLNTISDWYNSLSEDEKNFYSVTETNEIVGLWLDITFINSMSKTFPNKNFRTDILKNRGFSFVYSNKILQKNN
jgi:hypothetical protein